MEKTRKNVWLMAQGYRMSRLPFQVTWYWIDKNDGQVSELRTRTDDYNLDLYRRKGYVLNPKFLDPQAWHELEYGVKLPVVDVHQPKQSHTIPKASQGHQIGCERGGFLARNCIRTIRAYWSW